MSILPDTCRVTQLGQDDTPNEMHSSSEVQSHPLLEDDQPSESLLGSFPLPKKIEVFFCFFVFFTLNLIETRSLP